MKRLLLIEDDPSYSFQLEQLFKDKFEVQKSAEAVSAISQFSSGEFDVILLDIELLGDVDGLQLLNTIKSDQRLKKTPVIVLTSLGNQRKQEFLDAGADDYLVKGEVGLDELFKIVVKHSEIVPEVQPGEE